MYLNEWGPIAWELFLYITYSYKPELCEYYKIFFNSLYALIPCPHCSNDIKGILTSYSNYFTKLLRYHLYFPSVTEENTLIAFAFIIAGIVVVWALESFSYKEIV